VKRRDFIVIPPAISAVAMAACLSLPMNQAVAQTWQGLDSQAGSTGTWKKLLTKSNFKLNYTFPAGLSLNFNLRDFALTSGWNGSEIMEAVITIPSSTYVGSTSNLTPSFDTDTGYPAGTTISIVCNGAIYGCGGKGGVASSSAATRAAGTAGGPALLVRYTTTISGTGVIGGGGGGGGAGQGRGWTYSYSSCDKSGCTTTTNTRYFGGGGGGEGAGANRLGGGGGDTTVTTYHKYRYATTGGTGSYTVGGAGAVSSYGSDGPNDYSWGGYGGNGGTPGVAGGNGGAGGVGAEAGFYPTAFEWYPATSGGAPGVAVQGNTYITWITTPTRLGAILA
jgi:hypothetical protein